MLYRTLGKTGVDVSILGFGCMRLPVIGGEVDRIDYDKATALLHYAIDQGVNYVDTAYFYHGKMFGQAGESEPFVGEALSDGWRDRVHLATKFPQQLLKEPDDFERFLEEQLTRLKTDHIDFYLVHGVNGDTWARARDMGVREFLDKAKADGRIRFPAFSYHGTAEDFAGVVDDYDWAFAQIQYNYMDIDYQAGYAGLRYAADKGIGVVVMEPLKGGKLAQNVPGEIQAVFDGTGEQRRPAEWALRYVWNEPAVSLLLSGMNELDQVIENLAAAQRGAAESLTAEELALFDEARRVMHSKVKADCSACRYCLPCPSGVDIPGVLASLNASVRWDDTNPWMCGYTVLKGKASLCEECGQCTDMCPQGLPIPDLMKEAEKTFGS